MRTLFPPIFLIAVEGRVKEIWKKTGKGLDAIHSLQRNKVAVHAFTTAMLEETSFHRNQLINSSVPNRNWHIYICVHIAFTKLGE